MERKLRETLWDNERILWFGRPTRSNLFRAPDFLLQFLAWTVTVSLFIFSMFFFLPHAIQENAHLGLILVVLVSTLCLPIMVAIRPLQDKRLLERETVYAVTDQRIIAIVRDDVMIMPRTDETRYAINVRDGTRGNVCFNAAIGSPPSRSRSNAVLGFRHHSGHIHGLIFFHVNEPDVLTQVLACSA